jgi:hypothetical protein
MDGGDRQIRHRIEEEAMSDSRGEDKPPTYAGELWALTRILLVVLAGVAILFGGAASLNHFFGPVVAMFVLYAVFLAAMVAVPAWWSYKSKLRDWESRRKFEQDMERVKGPQN